ncbi:hypothetical protein OS493_040125 [Desmophyllum pertusum]|uniref:Uncharacterized protein n=1 Tax=Desmophyllum pertusum TaxID=174260 RepID=A0A9W9ZH17_9CNID|nr:hypothetical protein OS493_040125 [Desmophyllum pertusum]
MATCALAAALYVLNTGPIHSRLCEAVVWGEDSSSKLGSFCCVNDVEQDGVCSQNPPAVSKND